MPAKQAGMLAAAASVAESGEPEGKHCLLKGYLVPVLHSAA
jgi:hypothetical protein